MAGFYLESVLNVIAKCFAERLDTVRNTLRVFSTGKVSIEAKG